MRKLGPAIASTGVAFAITLLGLVTTAPASFAQAYPPPAVGVGVSASIVAPGGTVTVTGHGCAGGSTVDITLTAPAQATVSLGSTTADSSGAYSTTVTIPSNTRPGTYQLVATCGSVSMSTQLIVRSAAAKGPLPTTGANAVAYLIVALILIGGGTFVVLASRKRRRRVS